MIDELKPCPFHNGHTCECSDSLPTRVWNARPLEDGLRTDIARLTAELAAALKRAEAAEQSESGLARALTTAMAELAALREQREAGSTRALAVAMTEHRELVDEVEHMLEMSGCFPEYADRLRALLPKPPEAEND